LKRFEAAIFDLDGVIVDTAKYHYLAWKRLANELGFDFTEEQNEKLKGVSRIKSLEILLEIGNIKVDEKTKNELATKKNKWYVEYISSLDEKNILAGAKELILELKKNNLKIALGSASKNSMLIMKNINLLPYFDVIIDGNKVEKAKPDPEVFLLAAKELNINPSLCIVFEDAEAGIEAAKKANMFAVGLGNLENLKKADIVITSLLDLDIKQLLY